MRLLHYTDQPLTRVRSVSQGGERSRYDKPNGLWVSVEGEMDWREWCEAQGFGNIAESRCYEIALAPNANILRLATVGDVLDFGDEYGMDPFMGPMAGRTDFYGYGVRWGEVAERWQGIIIAPYQWRLRVDDRTCWYYSWDCASGCLWDASAVEAVREVVIPPQTVDC